MTLPKLDHFRQAEDYFLFCSQLNLQLLEEADTKKIYPTRRHFLNNLSYEFVLIPIFFINKVYDVAIHLFNFIFLDKEERKNSLSIYRFIYLTTILLIEFSLPFFITLMKMWTAVIGILDPQWGIKSAICTENGDMFSYKLWSTFFEETATITDRTPLVCREIQPQNASHYLGEQIIEQLKEERINNFDENQLKQLIFQNFKQLNVHLNSMTSCFSHKAKELINDILAQDLHLDEIEQYFIFIRLQLLREVVKNYHNKNKPLTIEYTRNLSYLFSIRRFGMGAFPHSINNFTIHPFM